MESLLLPGLRRHVMMRRCDFCDGKFGLIVETFQARRQFDALNLSGKITCVISVAAVLATASASLAMAQHPALHEAVSSVQHHLPITANPSNAVAPEPGRGTRLRPAYYEPSPALFNAYTYCASVQLAASNSNHKLQGEFRFPRFSAAPNISAQIIASISAVPMQVSAVQMSETVGTSGAVETKIVIEAETIFDIPASGFYFANLVVTGIPVIPPPKSESVGLSH
ncbi:MAG TPA: hypothetical protein VII14_09125 [Xanthobacteraceae bacterium]|jgi:hypothetical protein